MNPFKGDSPLEIQKNVVSLDISMDFKFLNPTSREAKDFLSKACERDAKKRWSAEQLLKHIWFKN